MVERLSFGAVSGFELKLKKKGGAGWRPGEGPCRLTYRMGRCGNRSGMVVEGVVSIVSDLTRRDEYHRGEGTTLAKEYDQVRAS